MSMLVVLALAVAMLAPAAPASAHVSPYCGHGTVNEYSGGGFWAVEYWSHTNVTELGQRIHYHHYIHHVLNGIWGWVAVHSVMKHCGTWH